MDTPIVPRVSAEELCIGLQQVLSLYYGATRRIRKLRRRRSNYASSCTIENLEIDLDRGKQLSLVFKDLSPASLLKAAEHVRPRFLYRPEREIETYRAILDPKRFGTPTCYGAFQRPDLGQYWLFLERVEGPLLWQVGRLELWERAAGWIARLHSHFAIDARGQGAALPAALLRYDRKHCLRWAHRAEDFLSHRRKTGPGGLEQKFKRIAGNYERVAKRVLSLPQSFIHGEFYPSNIILRGKGRDKRVCPIDWEVAAIGPGLIDLAALTSGTWSPDQRKRLVTAYRDGLEPFHGWPPPVDELLELLDYCQLHLAVQWLGWAGDWSPPETHSQDWLREALRLADRLGL